MKIYIKNTVLCFQKVNHNAFSSFDFIFNYEDNIIYKNLKGNILINYFNKDILCRILDYIQQDDHVSITTIFFCNAPKKIIKKYLKSRFIYVKAAGGLVVKNGHYLFMNRLNKWDLPKGKMERGEDVSVCALREVEEECNVKVKLDSKIGNTWHCYSTKSGWYIKKSTWFLMHCTDDTKMTPQVEEGIEELLWVDAQNLDKYLTDTYGTIKEVFEKGRRKSLI